MKKNWLKLFVIVLSGALAACGGAELAPDIVSPEPTLTSVFEPMLTPTPTPYIDTPAVVTPPADVLPGVPVPELASGQAITPTLVDFVDPLVGWGLLESADSAVSGFILRTQDGGQSWQPVNPQAGFPQQSRFFALDALEAWAAPAVYRPGESVTSAYIWHTRDGGQTWQVSDPVDLRVNEEPVVEYNFPKALFFLDAQHGWLVVSVGHYMNQDILEIFSTQDGGQTWQRMADKFSMGQDEGDGVVYYKMPCQVSGIAFVDPQHGFLAGDCLAVGVNDGWSILETKDGGRHWQSLALPEPAWTPEAVRSGLSSGQALCASSGVSLTPAGILVSHTCQVMEGSGMLKGYGFQSLSPDGGQTWRGWVGEAGVFVDANAGFSLGALNQAGAREFLATADGGVNWQVKAVVSWPMAQVDFVSPADGFVVASGWNEQRSAYDYALVRTRDGGATWEMVESIIK